MCVKELHNVNGYDPVKVDALIIGKLLLLHSLLHFVNWLKLT